MILLAFVMPGRGVHEVQGEVQSIREMFGQRLLQPIVHAHYRCLGFTILYEHDDRDVQVVDF